MSKLPNFIWTYFNLNAADVTKANYTIFKASTSRDGKEP